MDFYHFLSSFFNIKEIDTSWGGHTPKPGTTAGCAGVPPTWGGCAKVGVPKWPLGHPLSPGKDFLSTVGSPGASCVHFLTLELLAVLLFRYLSSSCDSNIQLVCKIQRKKTKKNLKCKKIIIKTKDKSPAQPARGCPAGDVTPCRWLCCVGWL